MKYPWLMILPWLVLLPALRPAAGRFPQEASDLSPDPAARFGTLSNGLRYAIMHNAEPKGRVSLRFAVTAGSLDETEDQRGLAHFLEHLAFNGSTHFPPGTLVEYFQRLGMSFGGDTNAFTAFDRTEYQLELPDPKPETLEKALTLFADYAGGLFLKPESIEKERGIILSEQRARDSVGLREWQDEIKFLFPRGRLPERLPIGLTEVIEHAPRERFTDFFDAWYRPENIIVALVGDVDPVAAEEAIRKSLAAVAARGPARPHPPLDSVPLPVGLTVRLHSDPDAPATNISIGSVSPYRDEPDMAAHRLAYLPRSLAVAMLNRRLSILAKQEGAPFSGGEATAEEQFHFFRQASIGLTCQPGRWRETLAGAEQELRRALEQGFQADELREAVANFRNALEQAAQTAVTRRSPELASGLVESVIDGKVFMHPAANLALLRPALEKATVGDCLAALRTAWNAAPGRYVYVSGNLTLAEPEKEIAAAYEASRAVTVAAPEARAQAVFAYADFGLEGKVAVRQEVRDLGLTLVEFKNGVRLNLKRTGFEAGRVRVNVRLGGGKLTEPRDQPGLSLLASGTFAAGGLGRHSADDLQRILSGRTVNFSFGVGDDTFVLGGTTNPADLSLQLQVMAAFVTDPGYRPEALRQFRKGMEQAYIQFAHTVEGPLKTDAPRLLANGDPRFGVPAQEVLSVRTMDEAKAWLAPQLATGPLEIALVGDLDVEATIAAVARTFGALPSRIAKPAHTEERRVTFPKKPMAKGYAVPTDIPRGIVVLQWPATDSRDVKRARRLNLLAIVLGDRLRVKLREQMGGTYSPSAGVGLSDTFTDYGFLSASATVAPEKADAVADAIKAVAADLARNGVTEDELQRAKEPVLTALRESVRNNGYWLGNVLAAAQEQPERLDWCRTRLADNEAITKADLDALAAQYLDPARAFQFISLPMAKTP